MKSEKTRVLGDVCRPLTHSLQVTDGLGMASTHQYNFKINLDHCKNGPAYHGNGHLLRGGSARTMNGNKSFLDEQFWKIFIRYYFRTYAVPLYMVQKLLFSRYCHYI